MALLRQFKPILGAVQPATRSNETFKVVTYNILANKYATGGNHKYCEPRFLNWNYRREKIMAELKSYDADIICLQEVEDTAFIKDFKPWMDKEQFQGWFLPRKTSSARGPLEGPVLMFKKELFVPLAFKSFYFKDVSSTEYGNLDKSHCFFSCGDGGILALLQHKQSKRQLLVASVHLFWNPNYPDAKVLQAAALCQQIKLFLAKNNANDAPCVVAGDFNSLWRKFVPDDFDEVIDGDFLESGVYTLLSTGRLPINHPDHPVGRSQKKREPVAGKLEKAFGPALTTQGLSLRSSQYCVYQREPTLTNCTSTFAGCLDYIWVSPHLRVQSVLEMPYKDPETPLLNPMHLGFPPIPDQDFPSDHLAMGCTLSFDS